MESSGWEFKAVRGFYNWKSRVKNLVKEKNFYNIFSVALGPSTKNEWVSQLFG